MGRLGKEENLRACSLKSERQRIQGSDGLVERARRHIGRKKIWKDEVEQTYQKVRESE